MLESDIGFLNLWYAKYISSIYWSVIKRIESTNYKEKLIATILGMIISLQFAYVNKFNKFII